MTATNHVVTGALIGSLVVTPWLAIPLAFGAHFALDSLPHMDYPVKNHTEPRFFMYLAIDMGLAASVLLSLTLLQPQNWLVLIFAGVACASPDLMWLKYLVIDELRNVKPKLGPLARFHHRIQKRTGFSLHYIAIELIWLLAAGSLLVWRLAA